MKIDYRKYLFSVGLCIITLLLLEAILQVLTFVSPTIRAPFFPNEMNLPSEMRKIDDPVLGHRPNPEFLDHDKNGFRNTVVRDSVQVVALGDSFTYGGMVRPDHAWPQQFEAITGFTTYSMSFGGWGPAHLYILLKEALEYKPELVVLGMYSGNDLFDCYDLVYHGDSLTEFRSTDEDVLNSIAESDAAMSLAKAYAKTHEQKREVPEVKPSIFSREGLTRAFKRHCRLWGLLRAVRNRLQGEAVWSYENPMWDMVKAADREPGELIFETPTIKTVFTSEKRLVALNLDDLRIQEGHRIALEVIQEMKKVTKEKGIEFIVILFPTKELTLVELVDESGMDEGLEAFRKLTGHENDMWEKTKRTFQENDVLFCDMLPHFREMLRQGEMPYRVDADGHLSAPGYKAVAELLQDRIVEEGLLSTAN